MALLEPYRVKQHWGTGNLTLQADPGEAFLVKDVRVYNSATEYATIVIDEATVGYWRVSGRLGNHLPLPVGAASHSHNLAHNNVPVTTPDISQIVNAYGIAISTLGIGEADAAAAEHENVVKFSSIPQVQYKTLIALLTELGIFKGYPVAEGQKLTIRGVGQANALQMVVYEIYEPGDITKDMQNGSDAKERVFVNYGRPAASITITGDTIYNVPQSPEEFPDFPFGKDVPAKREIEIFGILASDIVDDRGGNDSMNSEYIKLVHGPTTLFDEDLRGLFHKGLTGIVGTGPQIGRGVSLIGNFSDTDIKPPLMFPTPLKFTAGEELGVYLTTTAGAAQAASDLAPGDVEIGLIERVVILE